jgi:hypothetical protein
MKSQKNKTLKKTKVSKKYNTIKHGGMDPNNGNENRPRTGTFTRKKAVRGKPKPKKPEPEVLNNNTGALLNSSGNEIYGTHQAPPLPQRRSRKQSIVNFPAYNNLVNTFKVFVWDFDDTIVNKEKAMSYSRAHDNILQFTESKHLSMDPLLLTNLRDNITANPNLVQKLFFNPEFFVNLTSYLISNGCSVYIASFGFIDNIIEILNMLYSSYGKTSPFISTEEYSNVYGLKDDSRAEKSKWSSRKIGFLSDIKEKHQGENILFFDDDQANIMAQFDKSDIYGIKLGGYKSKSILNSNGEMGFHSGVLDKIVMYVNNLSPQEPLNKEILMDIVFH